MKKLAEKLIAANIAADVAEAEKDLQLPTAQEEEEEKVEEEKPAKKKNAKNFVFEDEENLDRFSTPPKAKAPSSENSGRTPLSSLNNSNKPKSRIPTSSTPKSKFHTKQIFNEGDVPSSGSKIPRSTRRLQQQVEGMWRINSGWSLCYLESKFNHVSSFTNRLKEWFRVLTSDKLTNIFFNSCALFFQFNFLF